MEDNRKMKTLLTYETEKKEPPEGTRERMQAYYERIRKLVSEKSEKL